MASRKLTDADKQAILELYPQPGETTSTLAERYGVSNSTISRVLKQRLPEAEYSRLIQQKRSGARVDSEQKPATVEPPATPTVEPEAEPTASSSAASGTEKPKPAPPKKRDRSRSEANTDDAAVDEPAPETTTASASEGEDEDADEALDAVAWDDDDEPDAVADLDDDDYGDDDLDDDDEGDDWDDDEGDESSPAVPHREQLEVLPFSDASFQRTYYLVVDRLSELITCPLRDFSDLGQIPAEEEQSRTLPVFNNHRVARRFSRRNQRVVKIPDGSVIRKTQPYLQAKGITRLLLDGQVYSLN
jgi:transposase-like protein